MSRPHSHSHTHLHGYGQGQAQHHTTPREPLARDAGRGKVLFLDAQSGISGDMTAAALVDLGVPLDALEEAVGRLALDGASIRVEPAFVGAIGGLRFVVEENAPQPQRTYRDIRQLLEGAGLEARVAELALAAFARLARAEARVHRVDIDEVHFHEVGAVDSICDIVCAAAGIAWIGARVVSTPLPLGAGHIECQHGRIPLPAPATLECLSLGGVPTYDAGIEAELVTPTGATIVATFASEFARWPVLTPERIGWGCGTRQLPDRPNALRMVLGAPTSGQRDSSDSPDSYGASPAADALTSAASHVLIEANVDDMTGELAGHVIELALTCGALDAWGTPITMKKSRPGLTLSVLATEASSEALAELLLRETSSLGVRLRPVSRRERPRRQLDVQTRFGSVPVKVSEGPYGPPQVKPEFDRCREIALAQGVPVREILAEALAAARVALGL
jgi:pyridinium-3,5-bisthiocarboxylic acid mononucleotide nickel chelatase